MPMRRSLAISAAALALFAFTASAHAQSKIDPSVLAPLKWRSIGPVNTSGRIDDFSVGRMRGEPDQIYVATATGGVFKSTNGGTSWDPVFDKVDAMMSIGAVRVAPSNANVVWVGTGEANNRQSSYWGDGVYKSTDAGKTWQNMGLKDTRSIARIVVDPGNYDIVYVAAAGHLWGPNPDRGVFKTTDGGKTWKKVLFVDDNTGATDLIIDPMNPQILYAATYQRQRSAWGFNGGGPGSAIYKTVDGGANWTKLTNGLPAGDKGRIGIDLFPSDSRVVYATVEAAPAEAGVYRTVDGGAKWEKLSPLDTRPMYYSQIRLDPKDRNRVYMLGSNRGFYVSDDGGKTFPERFSNIHSEDHALWVDPDDPNHLIVGGDGGVSISWDRAVTWDFRRNMPIGQFYEIDVDNKIPYTVCGGLQDNGLWCVPSAVRDRNGIADRDAWNIGGGDGFYAKIDPYDQNFAYEESQDGNVARVNLTTMEHQSVKPGSGERAVPGAGRGGGYRFNWYSPILPSSSDSKTVYMGANVLFKSTDRGSSWQAISPDLTLHIDRDTLTMMGARVGPGALSRNDGVTSYGTITSVSESPSDAKVIYAGTDDGQVQLTRDGGKTWTNVTGHISGLPARTPVTTVLASRFAAGRVYATFDGHYNDDYKPYVFVSDDFGQSWRSLSAGLPETSVNRIREHPHNAHVLILAHSRGVDFSNDGGATWNSLATNMPTVPVDDAIIHPRDNALIVGTHGRGIWILDDVGPLEALTADAMKSPAALAPIPRAREMSTWTPQAWYGHGERFSPNPEFDGVITYYLRDAASGPVSVEISDASGAPVRTLKGSSSKGLNEARWDLRMSPAVSEEVASTLAAGGRGGRGGGGGRGGAAAAGPLVLPGHYKVAVKIPGVAAELRGDMTVEGDPLTNFSDAGRRARQAIVMSVYSEQKTLAAAHVAARELAAQSADLKTDLAAGGAKTDSLVARISRLQAQVDGALTAATGAMRPVEAWSGLPTVDQRRQIDYAVEDGNKAVAELNRTIGEIGAMYASAHKSWARAVKAVGSLK
ncbi:MAG: WD40/YVTN/BNR-like repeat-containing protein [Gemmatimonadales bacterium]